MGRLSDSPPPPNLTEKQVEPKAGTDEPETAVVLSDQKNQDSEGKDGGKKDAAPEQPASLGNYFV
jgi:hypothetical protein